MKLTTGEIEALRDGYRKIADSKFAPADVRERNRELQSICDELLSWRNENDKG